MIFNNRFGISSLIHCSFTSSLYYYCFHGAVMHVQNIKTTDGDRCLSFFFFYPGQAGAYWLKYQCAVVCKFPSVSDSERVRDDTDKN